LKPLENLRSIGTLGKTGFFLSGAAQGSGENQALYKKHCRKVRKFLWMQIMFNDINRYV
jgi:hypothetical protein